MLRKITVFHCFLILINRGGTDQIEPGFASLNARLSNRILGGHDAEKHEFPHQVSLQKIVSGKYRHFCSGNIIYEQWVVTSANCLIVMATYDNIVVRAGLHNISSNEITDQSSRVLYVFINDEYKRRFGRHSCTSHDVALIKLQDPFVFNNKVSRIKLPPFRQNCEGEVTISGWGVTDETTYEYPEILQKVNVPIIDNKTCKKVIQNIPNVTATFFDETFLCTGPIDKSGISVCSGDFGGPVIRKNENNEHELVGIVSCDLSSCGKFAIPSIHTKVADFVWWIMTTIAVN